MESHTSKKKGLPEQRETNQEKRLVLWMLAICVAVALLAAAAVLWLNQDESGGKQAAVAQQTGQGQERENGPEASNMILRF